MRTVLLCLALALALSEFAFAAEAPVEPAPNPLVGTEWRLTRIPGRSLGQVPVQNHPRLSFDDARARGRGVCNPLTAAYTLTPPDGLVFGRVGGAMMACREGDRLEAFFINQLEGVQRFSLEGDTLEMVTRTGRRLQFGRLPASAP
jgi:heat shock protein HslJ